MGKRKIEMKLVENRGSRQVTFCKRRKGIFKKVKELSSLTPSHLGILIFSETGKPYSFGSPTIESVINKFHSMDGSLPSSSDPELEKLRHEYAALKTQLQKKRQESANLKSRCNLFKASTMNMLSVPQLIHLRDRLIGIRGHLHSHYQLMMMMKGFRDIDDTPPTSSNVLELEFPSSSVELNQDAPLQNDGDGGEHGFPTSPSRPLLDFDVGDDLDLDDVDVDFDDDDGFTLDAGSWVDEFLATP